MKPLCIVFGAGSIGKSVAGYCFKSAGADVIFIDIDRTTVEDLNRRGFYRIYTTEDRYDLVCGISAVLMNDEIILKYIQKADYICTSVGMNGIVNVLKLISEGLKLRSSQDSLKILLCENIPDSYNFSIDILGKKEIKNNAATIIETSVERMTKLRINDNEERDVIGEPFIPLIVNRERYNNEDFLLKNSEYFTETKKFNAYYYRKICTNNLGHAVLGYMGYRLGCKTLVDAFNNDEINSILKECLSAAGKMLILKYGFSCEEIENHISDLLIRYNNTTLNDEIVRVTRDPVRKLSKNERIIGTALKILDCGLDTRAMAQVACAAISFYDKNDEESIWLKNNLNTKGIRWVLNEVCEINNDNHKILLTNIEDCYKNTLK